LFSFSVVVSGACVVSSFGLRPLLAFGFVADASGAKVVL